MKYLIIPTINVKNENVVFVSLDEKESIIESTDGLKPEEILNIVLTSEWNEKTIDMNLIVNLSLSLVW